MFFDVYKALCAKKKMTPNGVAKEIGIASPSVTQWKHGSTPRPAVLQRIADYFDVSVEYLLTGEAKKESPPLGGELSAEAAEIIRLFDLASPELRAAALAVLKSAEAEGKSRDVGPIKK